jgi:hypothetical protein
MKTLLKLCVSIAILSIVENNVQAQLAVNSNGSTTINANIQDWWSGLKVIVPTSKSCAYHLSYLGKDRFYVCAEGWLWCEKGGWFGSDLKLKENINRINSPLSTVLKLNGIQFDYKNTEHSNGQRLGFIAQDVEKILPGLVKTMPDSTKAIAYTDVTALLVEAIKEQQIQIDVLKKQINNIDNSGSLKNTEELTNMESTKSIALAYLEQNAPNPFNQTTQIDYYLPENIQKATIYIYDMNGLQMKAISINQHGNGSTTINGSELRPGMYLYSLIADGKEIDTKRMILTD